MQKYVISRRDDVTKKKFARVVNGKEYEKLVDEPEDKGIKSIQLLSAEALDRRDKLRALFASGGSDADAAREFGVTRERIRQLRNKFNIAKKASRRSIMEPELRRCYDEGKTVRETAETITGCNISLVRTWLIENNLKPHKNKVFRLGKDEDSRRLELYNQGLSNSQMSRALDLSVAAVCKWRKLKGLPLNHIDHNWGNNRNVDSKVHRRRLELFEQGLGDAAIAEIMGNVIGTIENWRYKHRLPANKVDRPSTIDKPVLEQQKCLELFNQGLTDKEIGEAVGCSRAAIYVWRSKNNLPKYKYSTNPRSCLNEQLNENKTFRNEQFEKLHLQGMSGVQIAKIVGCSQGAYTKWLNNNGLAGNFKPLRLDPEIGRQRMELYSKGLSDKEIAEMQGYSLSVVYRWRERRGLPANKKQTIKSCVK